MRIVVADGVVFEGTEADQRLSSLFVFLYRRWNEWLRDAREAGDFGEMLRLELAVAARDWPHRFFVKQHGCDEEALERFLEVEKRRILYPG